jgi:hypothetical protein
MDSVALKVEALRCAACGSDVPVGDAEVATCTHCQATVPIPAEHRELRRLITTDVASRTRAETLLGQLATPPWFVTKVFVAVFDQSLFPFLLFFGAPMGVRASMLALQTVAWLEHALHRRSDSLPAPVLAVLVVGYVVALAVVPRLVGVYASRRGAARRMLIAGLGVGEPKLPGGPSTCRSCGAPIVVEDDRAVARCLYCNADNVMKLPSWFLAAKAKVTNEVAHTVEAAATMDATDRAETRRLLRRELARYTAWGCVMATLFGIQMWDFEREAVREHHEVAYVGIIAAVLLVAMPFVMIFRFGSSAEEKDDRTQRIADNGMPGWVGIVGPILFWISTPVVDRVLSMLRALFSAGPLR